MLQALLPAALSIGQSLMNRGKKASSNFSRPEMKSYESFKGKYDDQDTDSVHNFYDRRTKGADLGYSTEDLGTMNAQAIDNATHEGNELSRRVGGATSSRSGGMNTGGGDRLQRQGVGQMLSSRSAAMRDIAIKNAVLKHDDQWDAASGLNTFNQNERAQQGRRFQGERVKVGYDADVAAERQADEAAVNNANLKRKSNFNNSLYNSFGQVLMSRGK